MRGLVEVGRRTSTSTSTSRSTSRTVGELGRVAALGVLVCVGGCRGCGEKQPDEGRLNRPRPGCAPCAERHARYADAVLLDLSRRQGPLANRAKIEPGVKHHRYRLRSGGGEVDLELTAEGATRLELAVYHGDGAPASAGQRSRRCTERSCSIELSAKAQRGEELLVRVARTPPGRYRIRARCR